MDNWTSNVSGASWLPVRLQSQRMELGLGMSSEARSPEPRNLSRTSDEP